MAVPKVVDHVDIRNSDSISQPAKEKSYGGAAPSSVAIRFTSRQSIRAFGDSLATVAQCHAAARSPRARARAASSSRLYRWACWAPEHLDRVCQRVATLIA